MLQYHTVDEDHFSTRDCLRDSHSHTCAGGGRINAPAEHLCFTPGRGWRAGLLDTHCLCRVIMEAQRYPISVRLIGVMHKEKSKVSSFLRCLVKKPVLFYGVLKSAFPSSRCT